MNSARDPDTEQRATGSVLVVDDEEGIQEFARDCLVEDGHRVHLTGDAGKAMESLLERPFDVILLDLAMPGELGGMDVLRRTRAAHPQTQVVVITAQGSIAEAVEAMKLGAFDFVQKPLAGPEALRSVVRRALRWRGEPPLLSSADAVAPREGERSAHPTGIGRRFHQELLRRRVYRTAAGYLAGGFAVLQGAELILPAIPRSQWTYPILVTVVIVGFPVAVCLGWVYDIGWRGVKRTMTLDKTRT